MANNKSSKKSGNGNGTVPAHEAKRQGAYFLSLSLENVRCFGEKQTLDVSDGKGRPVQWTILLGNNGTGKTTVLQALACFGPRRRAILPGNVWPPASIARWTEPFGQPNFLRGEQRLLADVRVELSAGTSLDDTGGAGQRVELTANVAIKAGSLSTEFRSSNPSVGALPVCAAYGAGRRLGIASLAKPEEDDSSGSLFSEYALLRDAEEWLLRLDYSASKDSPIQDRQRERLRQIKNLLLDIFPEGEVREIDLTPPTEAEPNPRVKFHTPYGGVHLRQLGYGYQTLIAWMVDFASRMVERYPDSPNPLAEPAVVLVDEIDLHLHPQWQRKLIGHLTEHFPNTQFIATAHSPLVVQAAAGANIAVLRREGDHVVIDNDAKAVRGWRIDQIYTSDLFGLPSARPPELDEPLKRRQAILTKPRLTAKDKSELAELEEQIGDLPVGETAEQIAIMRRIEESLAVLAKAQSV